MTAILTVFPLLIRAMLSLRPLVFVSAAAAAAAARAPFMIAVAPTHCGGCCGCRCNELMALGSSRQPPFAPVELPRCRVAGPRSHGSDRRRRDTGLPATLQRGTVPFPLAHQCSPASERGGHATPVLRPKRTGRCGPPAAAVLCLPAVGCRSGPSFRCTLR